MKETVLDVLMYLFESFVDSEGEPEPNRNELKEELERRGVVFGLMAYFLMRAALTYDASEAGGVEQRRGGLLRQRQGREEAAPRVVDAGRAPASGGRRRRRRRGSRRIR